MKHLVLVVTLLGTAPVLAATYTIDLPGVPAQSRTGCHEQVLDMGGILSRATGVTILGAECERRDYTRGGFEATLTYAATRVLSSPVIVQDRLYSPYADEEACRLDLPRQKSIFVEQTGLTPLFAYCSPEGYQYLHAYGLLIN